MYPSSEAAGAAYEPKLAIVKTQRQKSKLKKTPRYTPETLAIRAEISAINHQLRTGKNDPLTPTELYEMLGRLRKEVVGNTEKYEFTSDVAKEIFLRANTENRDVTLDRGTAYISDFDRGMWQHANPLPVIFNIRTNADGTQTVLLDDGGGRMMTAACRGPIWLTVSIGSFYDKAKQAAIRTVLRVSKTAGATDRKKVWEQETGQQRPTAFEAIIKLYKRPTVIKTKDNGMTALDIENEIAANYDQISSAWEIVMPYFAKGTDANGRYSSSTRPAFVGAYMKCRDEYPTYVNDFFDTLFRSGEAELVEQRHGEKVAKHPVIELRNKLRIVIGGNGQNELLRRPPFIQSFIIQAFRWYVEYRTTGRYPYRNFSNSVFI